MSRKRRALAGRAVVVTGAASGIGRALAMRASRLGSPVAIADFNEEGLAETESLVDGPVLARKVDVSDRQSMFAFAATVDQWATSPIGAVINNAGVATSQPFADSSPEDDQWVLDTNFGGVVNGSHAFLPLLLGQGSGTLANVSSVFGLFSFPNQSAYCASKHAVRGFTEALRHEMRGTGVGVAVIHPGGVKTNILANARFHMDDVGNTDHERANAAFQKVARTTPDQAAKIIQDGIERGRPRIRVGADAVALDLLVRAAPVRYFGVLERLARMADR